MKTQATLWSRVCGAVWTVVQCGRGQACSHTRSLLYSFIHFMSTGEGLSCHCADKNKGESQYLLSPYVRWRLC